MTRLLSKKRLLAGVLALGVTGAVSLSMSGHVFARSNVGATVKQPSPTNHTITVAGHGEATAAPNMATITVGVLTKGVDAQEALASNATKLNAVVAAIRAQGVPADHIQTTNLSVYLDSQSNVYHASHDVTVKLDSVSLVGPVLDAAVAAGANNSWGVQFGLKDASVDQGRALTAAVADARKKADAMAAALGVSITGVGSASEASYNSPIQYGVASRAAGAPSASTQVQPGLLTTSADINVVYTFG